MGIKITDECINYGACEPECPNNAIYEVAEEWKFSEGTVLKEQFIDANGKKIDPDEMQDSLIDVVNYIVPVKCTECVGFYEGPQCAAVCPDDYCVPNEEMHESENKFFLKKEFLQRNF